MDLLCTISGDGVDSDGLGEGARHILAVLQPGLHIEYVRQVLQYLLVGYTNNNVQELMA